jgi:hypothetical protein
MAAVSSPYGLKPVNLIGGLPYSGSTRMFPIASGYAANIYNGSVVYVTAAGVLNIVTATGADATTNAWPVGASGTTGAIGVFLGCSYTNPSTKQKVFSQYWPTGTVAADAIGYVVDDERAVFQVQAAGTVALTELGANFFFSAAQSTSTGNTATGNSTSAVVVGASAIATTAPFRCVGFVDMVGFSSVGDAYTDILVKFNPGWHSYTCVAGL